MTSFCNIVTCPLAELPNKIENRESHGCTVQHSCSFYFLAHYKRSSIAMHLSARAAELNDLSFGFWTKLGEGCRSSIIFARWPQCGLPENRETPQDVANWKSTPDATDR